MFKTTLIAAVTMISLVSGSVVLAKNSGSIPQSSGRRGVSQQTLPVRPTGGGRPSSRAIRSISGNTFTIERESARYKVTVLPGTTIINSKGKNIKFSALKVGHQVQVIGDFTPSNTKAQWVKDLSL